MIPHRRGTSVSALLLMLALSGCVGVTPYGATVVSPVTAMQEFFSGNGSDAEPGPTHWDHR
jgi:hypothetical protein